MSCTVRRVPRSLPACVMRWKQEFAGSSLLHLSSLSLTAAHALLSPLISHSGLIINIRPRAPFKCLELKIKSQKFVKIFQLISLLHFIQLKSNQKRSLSKSIWLVGAACATGYCCGCTGYESDIRCASSCGNSDGSFAFIIICKFPPFTLACTKKSPLFADEITSCSMIWITWKPRRVCIAYSNIYGVESGV